MAAALAVLALVAGCTGDAGPSPEANPGPAAVEEPASPSAEAVVERVPLVVGGTEITVEVHPLVRAGEHVVLTYDLVQEGTERVRLGTRFGGNLEGDYVRLADVEEKQVYLQGVDAAGEVVGEPGTVDHVPVEGLRVQRVFAAPPAGTEALGLMLPGAYLESVPVIDADVPAPGAHDGASPAAGTGPDAEPLDVDAVADAPVHGLESFTRELGGAVDVLESTEQVQISLGGDVLFASSSFDLTPEAVAVVDAAAAHLSSREPGVVDVVGHTDDVGDDASNQVLSENRARAVADALAQRIDTSAYELRPSGRGEAEPLVPNSNDENRATNRRVVLTLTSQITTQTQVEATGELPEFDGPVATGEEGVLEEGARTWRYTAPAVQRVGDSLLVTLEVTAEDDEVDSGIQPGALSGFWSYRGEGSVVPQHVLGLTLMSGSTAVYPYDYHVGSDSRGKELWHTLGELSTLQRVDGGETIRFVALYPSIGDVDTVTLQLNKALGARPFRLTDIPVTD
ncbi:hypothetical protein DNL40_14740 [Xylanimonas oleitrophica]|uniref:OmpA-like domain-containing protein n=1 Tax=Xylanimonas oleitrophica TaxID=2607479 RepID=A0A2W5WVL5_9MICO|nr:hypothetical protein DNL40_14740 [Xylanimonas oleitrophica]